MKQMHARAVPERHRSDCQHCSIGNFAQHCRQRGLPAVLKPVKETTETVRPDQQWDISAITTDDEIAELGRV